MEVVMVDYHWRPFQDVRFYFFHDKQDEKCGSFKELVVYLTLIETQFYLLGLLSIHTPRPPYGCGREILVLGVVDSPPNGTALASSRVGPWDI
jgi:hypothetical protein